MDRDSALTRLQGIEAEIAALHAEQAQLLVLVASSAPVVEELLVLDRRPGHDGERMIRIEDAVREEVAAALRWSTGAAHARIDLARLLAGPLTATAAALAAGEISLGHVGAIADGARRFAHRWSSAPDERAAFTAACATPAGASAPHRSSREPLDDAAGRHEGGALHRCGRRGAQATGGTAAPATST